MLRSYSNLKIQNSSSICSVCKKDDKFVTDPESEEIICSNCGQVISDSIEGSNRSEGNSVSTQRCDSTSRIGAPVSLARHDMGLATIIGRPDKDAAGQRINTAMRSAMERLRTWDFRTQVHTSTDRN